MLANCINNKLYSRLCGMLVFLWFFSLLNTGINLLMPYAQWYITIAIFPFLVVNNLYFKEARVDIFFILAGLFILSIFPGLPFSLYPKYTLVFIVKLSLIFAVYLLINRLDYLKVAFLAFVVAVFINAVFLLLGMVFDIPLLAHIESPDSFRWLTLLNGLGSLAGLGLSVAVFSLYGFFAENKKVGFGYFCLFASGVFLIVFDGSKTCALALLLAVLFCGFLIFVDGGSIKKFFQKVYLKKMCVVFSALFFMAGSFVLLAPKMKLRGGNNFINMIKSSSLKKADSHRYLLIQDSLRRIKKNPILGRGMYSAGVYQYHNGGVDKEPVFIASHFGYLGIWANFGILAFISFVAFMFFWLPYVRKFFRNMRNIEDVRLKALGYNSVFLLFFFAFKTLFNPLGIELSDWVFVLIPAGIYMHFVKGLYE